MCVFNLCEWSDGCMEQQTRELGQQALNLCSNSHLLSNERKEVLRKSFLCRVAGCSIRGREGTQLTASLGILRMPPEELKEEAEGRKVWSSELRLLPGWGGKNECVTSVEAHLALQSVQQPSSQTPLASAGNKWLGKPDHAVWRMTPH